MKRLVFIGLIVLWIGTAFVDAAKIKASFMNLTFAFAVAILLIPTLGAIAKYARQFWDE